MVSGTNLPGQPQFWVGAVVLIAWTVVYGVIGTLITRTRDIS
jgi:ABC-2 type transport system permease protein